MQNNAGSFLAIARFILAHFPHLNWFPFWFNGQPFENSYAPMLHLMDAAFAWITGTSPARAYNFVTGSLYALGPVILFLAVWRLTGFLETAFSPRCSTRSIRRSSCFASSPRRDG